VREEREREREMIVCVRKKENVCILFLCVSEIERGGSVC